MSDVDLVARAAAAAARAVADAAVPQTRTVNAKLLTGNITLSAGDVGLGNVDNTSDVNKPVSTAQAAAIAVKANATHTHATSEVTGLDAALAGKASTSHASTHTTGSDQIADVTTSVHGLQRAPQFAEMYEYDNGTSIAIDTADTYHALFNAAMVTGAVNGWTFSAGASGTYTAVADLGVVGGVNQVRFTTGSAHILVAGQTVNLTSSSVAGYLAQASDANHADCFYVIKNVSDNTHFDVVSAALGTATGNWRKGAALVAGADAAGKYELRWACTFQPANANKLFKFEPRINVTPHDRCVGESKPSAADPRAIGSSCFIDVVAGDRIIMTCKNKTDAGDVTIIHSNIHVTRVY